MCTPYYQSRSCMYQKFALWTYSPFRHEVSLLYFSRNNLLRVFTYECKHCNIKCFNLNKYFFFSFLSSHIDILKHNSKSKSKSKSYDLLRTGIYIEHEIFYQLKHDQDWSVNLPSGSRHWRLPFNINYIVIWTSFHNTK